MSAIRVAFLGNPYIGVYALSTDRYSLVPIGLPAKIKRVIEETLRVRAIETKICQTTMLGILIAGNSNAMVVPWTASDEEIETIQSALGVKVSRLNTSLTALGNIILANDHGAIVHPNLREATIASIKATLGVKVVSGKVAGSGLVGSSALTTNKGALVSPRATEEELDQLSNTLDVPTSVGSVNRGVAYVRSGLMANSSGAIAGNDTTGPELNRIEEAFDLV
ncbi:MAG: translation initiation factor IF-6 [Candidatus Atabeyarchaeum deiterrae]